VFGTYLQQVTTFSQTQLPLLISLLILGYMFRFTRNHHQDLCNSLIALCNGSVYFREGLMMIPSESKHVAQGQSRY